MSAHPFREEFTGDRPLSPGLRALGYDRVTEPRPAALSAHEHGEAVEVCYLVDGQVDWWWRDEQGRPRLAEVAAGQAYVTRPRTTHGGLGGVLQPCELYWAALTPAAVSAGLWAALVDVDRPTFACPAAAGPFARLIEEHRRPGVGSREAATAAVTLLAVAAIRAANARDDRASAAVRRARRFIEKSAGSADFRVEDAAAAAGLSVGRLHARFVAELAVTPAALRRRHQIAAAKRLLATTTRPVTRVAHDCGFASSQYLAVAFRRAVGMTPGEYRRLAAR